MPNNIDDNCRVWIVALGCVVEVNNEVEDPLPLGNVDNRSTTPNLTQRDRPQVKARYDSEVVRASFESAV